MSLCTGFRWSAGWAVCHGCVVDVMGGGPVWISGWGNVQDHSGFCRAPTVCKSGVIRWEAKINVNYYYHRTLTRRVNLSLSSGGLPRLAGYSQSRSSPSKLRDLRKFTEWSAKSWRLSAVDTILVKGAEPRFQPPTASSVFRLGLIFFRALNHFLLSNNKIQTCKRFKRTLIYYDTNTPDANFGVIPFVKLQNDT